MEVNQLAKSVIMLVMIGMVVGVGLLVLDNASDAARTTVQKVDNTVSCNYETICTVTNLPVNPNYAISVRNRSVTLPSTSYHIDSYTLGTINISDSTYNNSVGYNVSYYFYQDNSATAGLDNTVTSLATVPSTWLPLIITVVALAIILGLVIKSFYFRG